MNDIWPENAKFNFGARVKRSNLSSGKPPAYRFPGTICGWYITPTGNIGFAVSSVFEPACIQIFPESGLEIDQ